MITSDHQQELALDNIALAQINPASGDLLGNTDRIITAIRSAKDQGAELVVLPEAAVSGYCVADTFLYDDFIKQNKKMLEEIVASTQDIVAIVGFVDYEPDVRNRDGSLRKYNAGAVLCDGKIAAIRHKTNLPNYRYFDDQRYFHEGTNTEPVRVTLNGSEIKIGLIMCEDGFDQHYDQKPVTELTRNGAEIIVSINASPYAPEKFEARQEMITNHISKSGVPFVYLNTVGTGDNGKNIIPFDGRSTVHAADGQLRGIARAFEEDLEFVKLKGPPLSAEQFLTKSIEQEQFDAIVMSLRDYVRKIGFSKVIVPVSGGIDSAVVLGLCVKALGPDNVIAYTLPSRFNSETTKGAAMQMMQNFGVQAGVIPIQDLVDRTLDTFEVHAHPIRDQIAKENLHARERGKLMMLESNDIRALLMSCGNKTEVALGYASLYGDMCGVMSPIGDLNKLEVYRMGRYINEVFGADMIPEKVFTIAPSAELSEGQQDPFDYWVVSPIVDALGTKRIGPASLVKQFEQGLLYGEDWPADQTGRTVYDKHSVDSFREEVDRCFALMRRSVFKRLQGPPIITLSESAYGFDRREPLMNFWNGYA